MTTIQYNTHKVIYLYSLYYTYHLICINSDDILKESDLHCFKIIISYKEVYLLDITPCCPLKVNRRFGGICQLHLQARKRSQERKHREAGNKLALYPRRLNST
jgi:hypothetical protein